MPFSKLVHNFLGHPVLKFDNDYDVIFMGYKCYRTYWPLSDN